MAQAILPAMMVAGAGMSAAGTIIGANSEAKALRSQANQLEAQAGLTRATSQREAMNDRRNAELVGSRGLALAAASGGGADDPTVVNMLADIAGEGEYRALTALYNGDQEALGMEAQAKANRKGAKATKTAALFKAGGTILSAGESMYDRYGK